ncbi:hypothetical protein MINTM005_13340 [Mycobacterium intracellulare]|nr:hypothetical protein MINTM005_13340 [Mycobacterium intracellulare]
MSPNPWDGVYANKIEVYGCDGSRWYISGPDIPQEAGVTLNPKLTGAIDAPVKTLWLPSAFGQQSQGFRWSRRDIVFSVNTFADDPETWMTVDSAWRNAWDYTKETMIVYSTSAGDRWISVRLLEEPKAYEGDTDDGKSPFLVCDSTTVMTVASELPFYQSETAIYEWEMDATPGITSATFKIEITNDSDVPVWPRWTLTDQATWTLPDFSWGSEEYSRPFQDAGRMVELPYLNTGEGVVVDADPRVQTIVSASQTNVQGRWKGQDLLYPIGPGVKEAIPVSVRDATHGAALRLEIPRWYSRPWSRPLP